MEAETESVEDKKQKIQQELKEMGFDHLKIKQALKATNTKEEATNFILAAETKLNEKVQDGEGSFEDVE